MTTAANNNNNVDMNALSDAQKNLMNFQIQAALTEFKKELPKTIGDAVSPMLEKAFKETLPQSLESLGFKKPDPNAPPEKDPTKKDDKPDPNAKLMETITALQTEVKALKDKDAAQVSSQQSMALATAFLNHKDREKLAPDTKQKALKFIVGKAPKSEADVQAAFADFDACQVHRKWASLSADPEAEGAAKQDANAQSDEAANKRVSERYGVKILG